MLVLTVTHLLIFNDKMDKYVFVCDLISNEFVVYQTKQNKQHEWETENGVFIVKLSKNGDFHFVCVSFLHCLLLLLRLLHFFFWFNFFVKHFSFDQGSFAFSLFWFRLIKTFWTREMCNGKWFCLVKLTKKKKQQTNEKSLMKKAI